MNWIDYFTLIIISAFGNPFTFAVSLIVPGSFPALIDRKSTRLNSSH